MTKTGMNHRPSNWRDAVLKTADAVRNRVLLHTLKNNGGYLSQACSSAEILSALYQGGMNLGPSIAPLVPRPFSGPPGSGNKDSFTGAGYNGPKDKALDRFIFSPVHYALVLYSVLIETGRLSRDALDSFNKDGSTVELIGAEHSPGHEVTAGSLGQALSQAGGIALARKLKKDTGRVFVFMSDGEFEEGQTWEALSALSYHRVDNLVFYIDANGCQCDGAMDIVMNIEPLADRIRAFGIEVAEVDGHDPDALTAPLCMLGRGKPLGVIARTDPCRGIPLLAKRADKLHYVRFSTQKERDAYQAFLDEKSRAAKEEAQDGV